MPVPGPKPVPVGSSVGRVFGVDKEAAKKTVRPTRREPSLRAWGSGSPEATPQAREGSTITSPRARTASLIFADSLAACLTAHQTPAASWRVSCSSNNGTKWYTIARELRVVLLLPLLRPDQPCLDVVVAAPGPRASHRSELQSGPVGCSVVAEDGRSRMWGLGVRTTQRAEGALDSKMEVAKVLICGGLVAVVAYGIYTCSCRLRHRRRARSYDEPASDNNHPTLPQRPKDLLEPLLDDSEVPVGLGQTWRGSRGRHSVPDLERGLETAVTAASEPENGSSKSTARKEVFPTGSEISKIRAAASSNLNPQNCKIQLEVIGGPVAGLRAEKQAVGSNAVLAIGRLPQNDLVLNDPEVSGKHVVISWNAKFSKWELVDMGSLNGTLVNSRPVGAAHKANASVRQRGQPTALANGDTITLGSSSNVLVRILASHLSIASAPFEVGVASDPMSYRRGGRLLPMEDVCLCEWPLRGAHEVPFGIFCVFDGHGGAAAAEGARRLMPQKMAELLAVEETRMEVLTKNEASDVLRTAFQNTEEALDYPYEGCTATVLLVWPDATSGFLAQCANVGDSHCIVSNGDKQLIMTEDHRLTSRDERLRLLASGKQLKEGENRLAGMNIARALGDKFLKEEEVAFSAEPYISNVFRLSGDGLGLVVMASDGLWDVLSPRRALQLAAEARERTVEGGLKSSQASAQGIAKMLVDQAREKRTKDNTSVVVLDFATKSRSSFHTL